MQNQIKNCQNCKNDFTIEAEDFDFYTKINVPPPAWCPDCRQQRRYAWRNERTLHRRNCDLCKKSIVTIYAPDSPYVVYCPSCWWSDGWDSGIYARDFDFSRSFFDQLHELRKVVPRISLLVKNSTNSDYTNHSANNKNCYLTYSTFDSENVMYSTTILPGKDTLDCYWAYNGHNEFLYECINVYRSYKSQFCFLVQDVMDLMYCFDCRNCNDCFLSYNLRGKSYCFMNEQLSREEYKKRLAAYDLGSHRVRAELYAEWLKIIQEKAIHKSDIEHSVDCTGNMIMNSKNAKNVFDVDGVENIKNVIVSAEMKDSMDVYHAGLGNSELLYECHGVTGSYSTMGSHLCYDNSFLQYCDTCHNSENLFGCISVKKGKYMILNKKYEEAEYKTMIAKIIEHLKTTGEYGQFFPIEHSPFGYNETQAQVYMPLIKEEAEKLGYRWRDTLPGTYGQETIQPEDTPDHIDAITDDITKEVLKCEVSGRNYNITAQELQFYRQCKLPIPRLHPDERYLRRIRIRPGRKLYPRTTEDGKEVLSAYGPDRPERIMSEEEYKKRIY